MSAAPTGPDEGLTTTQGHGSERLHLLDLFQQAPGFVCFLRGRDFVFERANAAYYQLVGHRDILGKPVREALPEVMDQGYADLLAQVFDSGEPFVGRGMPVALQREPGAPLSEAFVDLIYQPIRDEHGRVFGILAQGHDVTESKRQELAREAAEAALRASEARYRTLFESIDHGFCLMHMIVDADGRTVDYRFLEVNPAFEGQTGLTGATGKTALELVPGLDASWLALYGRVADTGEPARFENHDPAMKRWFDVSAHRVGAPELRQVALVFRDITDRKRIETELESLLVRESEARRQAEEATRLREEFLATVSHELRTPLAAILGWVQLLRVGGLPPEKRQHALETVERNARAQAQLIEDLLDVSSILAGKLRLEVAPLDLQTVVEAALETVRPAAEAKGVRLQTTHASESTVMGDAQRLQQVVWNLLSNAVKFTPRGGRVHVIIERVESSIEVTVADTGQGISEVFLPHVFERFRQADAGTTRNFGGLGLGLALVRHIVELHGGTVAADSAGEGKGARFVVRLPLRAPEPEPGAPLPTRAPQTASRPLPAAPQALAGKRVLVVDDDTDTRELLRIVLTDLGADVELADSSARALQAFTRRRPDLLLSDIGMPGGDGHQLIRQLRALPGGADLPAVALTAYTRSQDRERALQAGFDAHLGKPVDPVDLLAALTTALARPR